MKINMTTNISWILSCLQNQASKRPPVKHLKIARCDILMIKKFNWLPCHTCAFFLHLLRKIAKKSKHKHSYIFDSTTRLNFVLQFYKCSVAWESTNLFCSPWSLYNASTISHLLRANLGAMFSLNGFTHSVVTIFNACNE